MSSYNYLYRITNIIENRHYYGSRTCHKITPQEDLGIRYFSSSTDKKFLNDQKENPQNYRYKVIIISKFRKKVVELEIKLHKRFKVHTNLNFYNKATQSSKHFCTSGMITVKDKNNNHFRVSVNDPQYLSGELVGVTKGFNNELNKGKSVFKDKNGNRFYVSVDDPQYLSGELISINKGLTIVKDKNGNSFYVSVNDPRYLSGELVGINKGFKMPDKHQVGKNNSQYGTMWISFINPNISKKIKKELLPLYHEQGWIAGRNKWNSII
jgi:hypothetical protein